MAESAVQGSTEAGVDNQALSAGRVLIPTARVALNNTTHKPINKPTIASTDIVVLIMASYVITGTSKGIGLELVKQLLELPASQVSKIFAITRNTNSKSLNDLVSSNSDRLVNVVAEVQNEDSMKKAAAEVGSKLGGSGLDVLVNNAGVLPWDDKNMENVRSETLHEVFDVNVVSVNRVTAAFLPLLQKGNKKQVFNM